MPIPGARLAARQLDTPTVTTTTTDSLTLDAPTPTDDLCHPHERGSSDLSVRLQLVLSLILHGSSICFFRSQPNYLNLLCQLTC